MRPGESEQQNPFLFHLLILVLLAFEAKPERGAKRLQNSKL